ncbi:class I adenylate-forming enzyme family protein [Actinophytocola glycyrrhizae]|uniref:Class I adenylate-forming enzyme family protein n=1 Tax=Actinophytocola glycyrrhizae TaxID=2044873 RepID=A0ABV9RXF1_9PSEU
MTASGLAAPNRRGEPGRGVPTSSWWGEDLLGRSADDTPWARGASTVTAGRMRTEVAWLRKVYGHQGIGARSTVSLHGTPSFTQLWSVFALWSLGAQVTMLEQRLAREDRAVVHARTRPQFHMTFGGSNRMNRPFTDECEVLVRPLPDGEPAVTDHCLVHLSSGTTGQGKIIGRTPDSLLTEVDRLAALDAMPRPGEQVLILSSWAHSFELIGGVLHGLDRAATLVFPTSLVPERLLLTARDAQVLIGTPRHFELLSAVPGTHVLPELRVAISGGEVLNPSVFARFARRYGVRIGQVYGTTEAGIIATDLAGAHPPPNVGLPVPGVRVRIEDGELEVHLAQSPYLTEAQPWFGGWMSTQDRVVPDPETGVLRLCGRSGDERADRYPEADLLEIERVLRSHRDVDEAVVTGVDAIEAHVSGSPGLDHINLMEWCRRLMGETNTPARCHVVSSLPRTANGKSLRTRGLIRATGFRPAGGGTP